MKIKFFVLILFSSLVSQIVNAQLVTYNAPAGISINNNYSVKVRQKGGPWKQLAIYEANIANVVNTKTQFLKTAFCSFDLQGEVEVSVQFNAGDIKTARIRPLSFDISPTQTNNTLNFTLKEPKYVSIEINGDLFHNLQLFANPIQHDIPDSNDKNVIYFAPGLHCAGIIRPKSNQSVYIAGGAVVQGQILINNVENVRVYGHGILTQLPLIDEPTPSAGTTKYSQPSRNDQLTIHTSKNIQVDGITVLPHKYSMLITESSNLEIANFKSFSSEGNADGIDIFCSSDISIKNIFMRNSDDCIAIYGHRWNYYGNVKRIAVEKAVLWADVAHPILVGTHGDTEHPDTLSKLTFKDIDVLEHHEHQVDYQGCLSLNAGDSNLIQDVIFENIRVEDFREGQLFNLRVMFNHKYNTSPGMGIRNVLFKNVVYNGKNSNLSIIAGYDQNRKISDVRFENMNINGTIISDDMPGKPPYYKTSDMARIFLGEHTENIKFINVGKQ